MSYAHQPHPKERSKILVVGPAWVGDMVMTNTLFQLLAMRPNNPVIDVLAPDWTRPLLARMPEVRRAISMPIGHGNLNLKKRFEIGTMLKRHDYDEAILIPNSWKSALIPFFANIKKRVGWRGEMRYGLLNDIRRLEEQKYPLFVERCAALAFPAHIPLPTLPNPRLFVDKEAALRAIAHHQIPYTPGQPVLALCPGAEFGSSKRWPEQYFAEVAAHYAARGYYIWLFGSQKDQAVTTQIQAQCNHVCVDLAGKTSLAEAIDLMSLATIVLSNDSGLMHIAAALDKPLVAVYGSTSPAYTPPLSKDAIIVRDTTVSCSPCFKRECPLQHHACMQQLTPNQVIEAMEGSKA